MGNHLLTALLLTAAYLPFCRAQDACFTAADITGSVLGTFFSTLAAIAIGFIVYWFFCRKRPDKPANLRPCDDDIEKHAYSNPFFQDDEPDKAATLESTENGKNDIGPTKLTISSDKVPNNAATKGNKKAKATRGKPFSVFTNSKVQHPQRALDDSCIHQEPERIEVCLRGSDFTGLGFNICGNIRDGIYVRDVLNRGPAGESGKIKAGDRIYNVTVSFEKITIEDALTILSYASPYDVILDVQKTSEQGGSFIPGHQKKGSMDSSTSGSLGSGGERLSHPIYRSQSSDDVSHIGNREVSSNSKRSLSVGVVPVRLKKDASNKPNAPSLQEQTIKEGNSQSSIDAEDSNQPQHSKEKVINVLASANHDEVQIVIHNEDKVKDGELIDAHNKPSAPKTNEMLVKRSTTHSLEPFQDKKKEAKNTVDNSVNNFTNPFKTSSKMTESTTDSEHKTQFIASDELTNFVSPSMSQNGSTPSVKVSVQTPDSTILDIDKIHLHFPEDINNYSKAPNNGENKINEKALFKIEHNSNSTNPFDVRVASHKIKQNNVDFANPSSADGFNDSTEFSGSIFSKDLSESILNSLQQNSPKELKINNKQTTNASASITDSLNDSLPDFDIFIPNLDLDDLQETLQATMIGENVDHNDKNRVLNLESNKIKHLPENASGVNSTDVIGITAKRRNQFEDIKRNGKVFTEDEINSHWQAIEGHIPAESVAETASLEIVQEQSNIESFIDSLETPATKDMKSQIAEIELAYQRSTDFQKATPNVKTSSALKMNGRSHVVTTEDDDEITLDSLENTSAKAKTLESSKELSEGKKQSKNALTMENPAVSSKRKAPSATVQLPRVDIKIPTNIDFESCEVNPKLKEDQKLPAKDKSMLNAVIIDSDLNENIEYFESKMQSVLQKSPKIKSKRSSVPGKRKAPPPPSSQQSATVQQNDLQSKENSKNPFVVGLTPMSSNPVSEENPTYKSESVVYIQPNNVTTVQVNAPLEGFELKDTQTSLSNNIVETTKTSRKTCGKADGNFGFGYLKTNFFEGLDKAGEEDLHLMSKESNRFHSIPRTGRSYEIYFKSKNTTVKRSSSLGDLTKIEETVAKSPPLERAVSMDLKSADDVLSGKFEELKMHVDPAEISQLDTSDETVLSAHEITDNEKEHLHNSNTRGKKSFLCAEDFDAMANHENFNSHDTEFDDLTNSQNSPELDKQTNKKFNILQGFFKKDKRKKKEASNLNVIQTAAAPVSPSMTIRTTASIMIDNDHGNMNKHSNTNADSDQELFVSDKEVINEETLLHPNNFAKRQQSLSSSSLSEDSIDGDGNCDSPPKRRMVAVDPSLKENFSYDSDSDENQHTEKKIIHLTTETVNNFSSSSGMKVNNESHDEIWRGMTKESSSVTIPIIPPIITSKDVRSPTTSREDLDEQYQHHLSKSYDGISEDGLRHSGPVRSLSPTKFPRPWSSGSESLEQSHEENGDSEKDHQERNSSELTSYHYTFNYNPSKSGNHIPQNDGLSVTTMHVTVSNNSASTKNSIVSGEPFNTFPGVPQTNISKTVIISNSQLSLPMESSSDNSGPESPPPTLQPAE